MEAAAVELPEDLIRAVYPELRRMAAMFLRRERPNHTLQRTALVHEALLRVFGRRPMTGVPEQALLALAARQMRQALIDHGRKHRSQKRGSGLGLTGLGSAGNGGMVDQDSLFALNAALEKLGAFDARALSVVELKFFCGFTNEETAQILGVCGSTVETDWQFARAWLYGVLGGVARSGV
ncbi:MAG: sigma-70 family RNA polymerase sigma factor [Acidobacteria bacterium]|nr:sigma-70 family RNA polymerase sigma factor [Acidobacteriota bacterium]